MWHYIYNFRGLEEEISQVFPPPSIKSCRSILICSLYLMRNTHTCLCIRTHVHTCLCTCTHVHTCLWSSPVEVHSHSEPSWEDATCQVVYALWGWREAEADRRSALHCHSQGRQTHQLCGSKSCQITTKNSQGIVFCVIGSVYALLGERLRKDNK